MKRIVDAVVSVTDLLERDDNATRQGIESYRTISETTVYGRKKPAKLDVKDIDEAQRGQAELYFSVLQQQHQKVGHFTLNDATVVGQGSVITKGGCLIRESAAEFLAHDQAPDGLVKSDCGAFELVSDRELWIDRPSLLLKRPWYKNYGHWLVDAAPLAALASRFILSDDWQVVVGEQDSRGMMKVVAECLELLLPDTTAIAHPNSEVWRFRKLHYVTPVHIPPLFKFPLGLMALQALTLRKSLNKQTTRRRLYIRRRIQDDRALDNEEDVLELCGRLAIDAVYPEELTFIEQAELFHSADLVLGVKGAAMTNTLFCPAGAHVVIMSPSDFSDPFYWDLVAQGGADYSEIFGKVVSRNRPTGKNPFHIDVGRLQQILDQVPRS